MMTGRLAGRRILVVEDEYFVASDIKRALAAEDAVVIGPAGQVDSALELAGDGTLDAAVLDVNLGKETTYPIADLLRMSGTPWLFVTGYDAWAIPPGYRNTPQLAKPFAMGQVIDMLADLIDGGTEG